jgi:hypothetical protein
VQEPFISPAPITSFGDGRQVVINPNLAVMELPGGRRGRESFAAPRSPVSPQVPVLPTVPVLPAPMVPTIPTTPRVPTRPRVALPVMVPTIPTTPRVPTIPTSPRVPINPVVTILRLPATLPGGWDWGGRRRGSTGGRRSTSYGPSLSAITLGSTSSRPSRRGAFSGLEIRPIITGTPPRRSRRRKRKGRR